MSPTLRDRVGPQAWPLLLAIGLPLLATLLVGGDSNWDLRNYHLYDAHALLSGRAALDVAPAQVQSWHNPLLDLPMYWLATSGLPARMTTLWLALPAMATLWCLLCLQSRLSPTPPTRLAQAVLAALAFSGAAAWSTFASSMDDGFVAAGIALALCFVVDAPERRGSTAWALAGLAAGATAGLKLSAAIYCVALAVAALPGGGPRDKAARVLPLALGGLAGFTLSYGWWGWRMAAEFGNPVFPYFNQWFHSRAALPLDFADARFRPHSVGDALLAPVHLLRNSRLFSELTLRDPRLLCALLAFPILGWRAPAGGLRTLAVFVVAAFACWIAQYGIYRYAIVLEVLGALGLVLALQRVPGKHSVTVALVLAFVLVSADTRRPHWGRDATGTVAGLRAPSLGSDALVVTASDAPLAYLALGLPAQVPLVGLANNFMQPDRCTALQSRAAHLLASHAGPMWLLSADAPAPADLAMLHRAYGFDVAGPCVDYPNPLAAARLCPLRRVGPVRTECTPQAR